jgi:hypothetical protein
LNRILIKCPTTGKYVYTGFTMEPALFDVTPIEAYPVECPHCRQMHAWQKKDAFLERDSSPTTPNSPA